MRVLFISISTKIDRKVARYTYYGSYFLRSFFFVSMKTADSGRVFQFYTKYDTAGLANSVYRFYSILYRFDSFFF